MEHSGRWRVMSDDPWRSAATDSPSQYPAREQFNNDERLFGASRDESEPEDNQQTKKNKRPRERNEAPNLPKKMAGTDRTIHYDLHRTKPSPKVSGAI